MISWEPLEVSEEDQKILDRLDKKSVGASLPDEKLNEFRTGEERDFDVETEAGTVHVYFYRPVGSEGKTLPLYINLHGGGFVKGRRDQDMVLCRNYCSRAGVAVLDIDYLPAPSVRYPGQIYQNYGALQYALDLLHAKELGIDPERVMLGGHSAGANLAAASTLMAVDRGGRLPKKLFLDYGIYDLATPTREKRNGASNAVIPPELSDFFVRMYVDADRKAEPYCSLVHATGEQLSAFPPTTIFSCDPDPLCDEGEAFGAKLVRNGVPVLLRRFMYSNHAFVVRRNGEYHEAERMIVGELISL